MNIGKVIKIVYVPRIEPISIPVKNWPAPLPTERPIEVPNWTIKVPEKVEVR